MFNLSQRQKVLKIIIITSLRQEKVLPLSCANVDLLSHAKFQTLAQMIKPLSRIQTLAQHSVLLVNKSSNSRGNVLLVCTNVQVAEQMRRYKIINTHTTSLAQFCCIVGDCNLVCALRQGSPTTGLWRTKGWGPLH